MVQDSTDGNWDEINSITSVRDEPFLLRYSIRASYFFGCKHKPTYTPEICQLSQNNNHYFFAILAAKKKRHCAE